MFHSKISRKKKLCLDSLVLNESTEGNYTYSFKIDKHYFNIIQDDNIFDLRIDNRSFSSYQEEEKFKPKINNQTSSASNNNR